MTAAISPEAMFVATALKSWEQVVGRTGKVFDSLSDEQMLAEIVPGKNRPIYLLGHLVAVNDAMIPQLRLGEPRFFNLREPFITQPDNVTAKLPGSEELRKSWKDVNLRIADLFSQLAPVQWLERHSTVSEEEFAKEPHRNRLALLQSRTNHVSYHLGQLMLIAKPH